MPIGSDPLLRTTYNHLQRLSPQADQDLLQRAAAVLIRDQSINGLGRTLVQQACDIKVAHIAANEAMIRKCLQLTAQPSLADYALWEA